MAQFSRSVHVTWNGGLMDGKGSAKAGTGAFELPVSFPSRIGEPAGTTSPEELIAAAHASCFAMAFNATLGRKGGKAAQTRVTATVTAEKGDAGISIVSSQLAVAVSGLEGIDASQVADVATAASQGCPVSKALKGNVSIDVQSSVE